MKQLLKDIIIDQKSFLPSDCIIQEKSFYSRFQCPYAKQGAGNLPDQNAILRSSSILFHFLTS